MKIIKYLFPCSFLLLATIACNKLDEYNPSGATADAVWSTPQGFETLVNAAYSEQRAWYGKEDGIFMGESGTDLWFNANKSNYANQLTRYEGLTPSTGNPNKAVWKVMWRAINLCNAGINRIDQAGFTDSTQRNQKLGELRFLRGFYYWHVVETWGGVMLKTQETQGPELTATRSSVADFYKLIISDLQFAADNLPNSWGAEYSRATKKSALGMLARAYLSRAYYATGAERDDYFTKARDIANEVISRKAEFGVDLWSNVADLWNPANNKNNKEALYIVSNTANNPSLNYDNNGNRLHAWYLTSYSNKPGLQRSIEYGYDGQKRLQPTLALLDMFDEQKDARYSASFQEVWICNKPYTWTANDAASQKKDPSVVGQQMVEGIDTALYITKKSIANESKKPYIVVDRDSLYNTLTDKKIKGTGDFVPLKKFLDYTRTVPDAQPGYNDIMVIRLAEMYLIAAEAEFQLGHPDIAADAINVLRTRAAVKTPVDYTEDMLIGASDITLDFILDERARELCGEHLRWFDLKRTGKLVDRVHEYNPDITAIQSYHNLRPVPQDEINALLNGQEFGQNPGY